MAMVRRTLENRPKLSKEYLDSVAAIKDEDIDCSDIPEMTEISGLVPMPQRKRYNAAKTAASREPEPAY